MKRLFDEILVSKSKKGDSYKIVIDNLPATFGVTLKNFLRRSFITFYSTYKVFAVQIEGVKHELQNKEGILESTIDILENLQKINFSHKKEFDNTMLLEPDERVYTFKLNKIQEGDITSDDFYFEEDDSNIEEEEEKEIENLIFPTSQVYLFNKTNNLDLNFKILVRKDTGFVSKLHNLSYIEDQENTIVMDTDFSSLEHVDIQNEEFFSSFDEKKERLNINLISKDTNLINKLSQFTLFFSDLMKKISSFNVKKEIKKESKIPISSLKFSKRVKKCLDSLEIKNLRDLENFSLSDLKTMQGIGRITLSELKDLMKKHNIEFKV